MSETGARLEPANQEADPSKLWSLPGGRRAWLRKSLEGNPSVPLSFGWIYNTVPQQFSDFSFLGYRIKNIVSEISSPFSATNRIVWVFFFIIAINLLHYTFSISPIFKTHFHKKRILQKRRYRITIWSRNSTTRDIPKELISSTPRDASTLQFMLYTMAKRQKQSSCPDSIREKWVDVQNRPLVTWAWERGESGVVAKWVQIFLWVMENLGIASWWWLCSTKILEAIGLCI